MPIRIFTNSPIWADRTTYDMIYDSGTSNVTARHTGHANVANGNRYGSTGIKYIFVTWYQNNQSYSINLPRLHTDVKHE